MANTTRALVAREERRPLLGISGDSPSGTLANTENGSSGSDELHRLQLWRLYLSHFLSTWNTRTYEFAAILFFAKMFPNTLLPTSIRGVLVNISTLCLSSTIGRCIDHSSSRLRPLQVTIFLQRASIFFACMSWASIAAHNSSSKGKDGDKADHVSRTHDIDRTELGVVIVIVLVSIVESLCAVGNTISMERDWVPSISTPTSTPSLYVLSATMRRIDIISKLVAPAFVSVLQTWTGSATTVAVILAVQNLASIAPEWFAVYGVWKTSLNLRKERLTDGETGDRVIWSRHQLLEDFRLYFDNDIWIPSFSSAMQSFSVLSMSGLMTTYLIAIGYSLSLITTVRILSSLVELAPTIFVPWLISLLLRNDVGPLRTLSRIGTWGLGWQTLCLIAPTIGLFYLQRLETDPASFTCFPAFTSLFFVFICLSRFGTWTHNLIAQNVVQITVPVEQRAQFSGVEMAFVSAAEIARWSCGAIWPRPAQFPGLGTASLCNVTLSYVLFRIWASKRDVSSH